MTDEALKCLILMIESHLNRVFRAVYSVTIETRKENYLIFAKSEHSHYAHSISRKALEHDCLAPSVRAAEIATLLAYQIIKHDIN